jgi:alpha-amylase/alpha-mannosidase (GH57 family)
MKKLKVAILWHQHQPYYKYNSEDKNGENENIFSLPWVRFHGIKDYYDLPALLNEFPNVKQNFNLVPALMLQINDYIQQNSQDKIQKLTKLKAKFLNENEKKEILESFFILNYENMLKPYERYNELFEKCKNNSDEIDVDFAIKNLETQDWLDIQVWYNLAWIGQISRLNSFSQRLFRKKRNFTEEEKLQLLDFHNEILSKISVEMKRLEKLGQIEVSVSPMFHPILPLLCDSTSALEATPNIEMPNPIYKYPEDAKAQIAAGIEYYNELFGKNPKGMWPSEGSISAETLELITGAGIKWVASDEGILEYSCKKNQQEYNPLFKYFPHEIATKAGDLTLFFRDHNLSDKIGFLYSNWYGSDAASDFRDTLGSIRNEIIQQFGEDALDSAVVPIILDGENCWEFYFENGIYFLRDFFSMLESSDFIETVLFSECLNLSIPNFLPNISQFQIRAGSWINSNFNIWIGHQDDVKAWNMLSKVRMIINKLKVENEKAKLSAENYSAEIDFSRIMEDIYIAEGSDWFWWYGPEHNAPNKQDFDVLFRWRIRKIYEKLNLEIPDELNFPIGNNLQNNLIFLPKNKKITPKLTGNSSTNPEWRDSGEINLNFGMSTMHKIGEIISKVRFCFDENFIYFRINLAENFNNSDKIEFIFADKNGQKTSFIYENSNISLKSDNEMKINFAKSDLLDISLERTFFEDEIKFKIITYTKNNSISYPQTDFYIVGM